MVEQHVSKGAKPVRVPIAMSRSLRARVVYCVAAQTEDSARESCRRRQLKRRVLRDPCQYGPQKRQVLSTARPQLKALQNPGSRFCYYCYRAILADILLGYKSNGKGGERRGGLGAWLWSSSKYRLSYWQGIQASCQTSTLSVSCKLPTSAASTRPRV